MLVLSGPQLVVLILSGPPEKLCPVFECREEKEVVSESRLQLQPLLISAFLSFSAAVWETENTGKRKLAEDRLLSTCLSRSRPASGDPDSGCWDQDGVGVQWQALPHPLTILEVGAQEDEGCSP